MNEQVAVSAPWFFMATVLATYVRQVEDAEVPKQRTLNVLLQAESPNITKNELNVLNRSAISRMCQEHEITPDAVRDVVFLNITPLGMMTPEQFHGDDFVTEKPKPAAPANKKKAAK
jgi:hypothetical protein